MEIRPLSYAPYCMSMVAASVMTSGKCSVGMNNAGINRLYPNVAHEYSGRWHGTNDPVALDSIDISTLELLRQIPDTTGGFKVVSFRTSFYQAGENDLRLNEAVQRQISPSQAIVQIRSSLDLQVKELATILHVERPTIYSWMKEDVELHKNNRARLQTVLEIANCWNELAPLPLPRKALNLPLDNSKSLLDLLHSEDLDIESIKTKLKSIVPLLPTLRSSAKGVQTIAKELGMELNVDGAEDHVINVITGKRIYCD